jgi:UDP-N-acetylmuramate--alanine ligase
MLLLRNMKLKYKNVYFSGIGGIGVSALAKLFLKTGIKVTGSDLAKSPITEELEKMGVKVYYEQVEDNVTHDFDLLVYSPAVPESNPERKQAFEHHIEQKSYPEVLGILSKSYKTIAVSGTKGKSTTTALIADFLMKGKLDPTVILGSKYSEMKGNFRHGKSDKLVIEACEYRGHMLHLSPKAIVLTNIELDHLDYFRDINHIIETFQQYIDKLTQSDDILVINNDDINCAQLKLPNCHVISYAINENADLKASNIVVADGKQKFNVSFRGTDLGEFEIRLPGRFSIYNALAAMALSLSFDVKIDVIRDCLKNFKGIWRRFERVYDKEIMVISDYAHVPFAVSGMIAGVKEFFPDRRLVTVFQPHHRNRTINLFKGFVEAFGDSDVIILSEIYDVAGREAEEDRAISSNDLVKEIKKLWPEKKVLYAKDLQETLDLVNFNVQPNDVVLVMGAGDLYLITDKIKVTQPKE